MTTPLPQVLTTSNTVQEHLDHHQVLHEDLNETALRFRLVTSSATAMPGEFIYVDTTTAAATITLPASPSANVRVGVKKADNGPNFVTIITPGTELIDGHEDAQIVRQYAGAVFAFNGTNWVLFSPTMATAGTGPQGPSGPQGPQGGMGPQGPTGPGGGTLVYDGRWTIPPGHVSIDEFKTEALDPAWTKVDFAGGAGRASWAQGRDMLSAKAVGGDAGGELHCLLRPIDTAMAVGDAFETCLTLFGPWASNYVVGGIVVSNTVTPQTGSQLVTLCFSNTSGNRGNDVRQATNFSVGPGGSSRTSPQFAKAFTRLVLVSAGVWRVDVSPDGVQWLSSGTHAFAFVPTYVGFFCTSLGSGVSGISTYDYLRRTSGVT